MIDRIKSALSAAAPSALKVGLRACFGWRWFHGNYRAWSDARSVTGGYNTNAILDRVLTATLAVRNGDATFERDGVVFTKAVPEPGLIAALRQVSTQQGRLRVLDFGGALGTTYWRHRKEFDVMEEMLWDVVEQPQFVAAGKAHFSGSGLRFFNTIEEAEVACDHDVLLASGTLQYLEFPHETLAGWMAHGWSWLLLNNLPLHRRAPDRIAVQRVPPEIYPASYPVWFFNRERFLAQLIGKYEIVSEFAAEAVWPVGWKRYPSTGLLLRRI